MEEGARTSGCQALVHTSPFWSIHALRSLPPFLDHKERTFCAWVKVPPV